ncbi:oxepin-CoA hydrolase, alternative type, partial [Aromatoleum evansii]|uniref:oxepin-CoA hydrolase, alternative type n=1 Tax=Aromatoleum evansii TaxID=59406 RepID=UPI00145DB941
MTTNATTDGAPGARLLVRRHGAVLQLTLSNPALRNALHPDIYAAGLAAVTDAAADPTLGAIVLTGEGAHFCAGGNVNRLAANRQGPREVQRDSLECFHRWVQTMRRCPLPIVAAVEGSAAGAGFSLALASDLIVAAESAQFRMAYVKIGLSPDGGGSAFASRVLPRQLAAELLLTGAPLGGRRLQELGVVNRVVADGTALAEALALAQSLARGPRRAQGRIKTLLDAALTNPLQTQLDFERDHFLDSLFGPEA